MLILKSCSPQNTLKNHALKIQNKIHLKSCYKNTKQNTFKFKHSNKMMRNKRASKGLDAQHRLQWGRRVDAGHRAPLSPFISHHIVYVMFKMSFFI